MGLDDAAHVIDGRVDDLVAEGLDQAAAHLVRGRVRVRVGVRARARVRVQVRVRLPVTRRPRTERRSLSSFELGTEIALLPG